MLSRYASLVAFATVVLWMMATALSGADENTEPRLTDTLGRSDVRVLSAAFEIPLGATVEELALAERLERQNYRRVRQRPERPGEFFWGHEVFWIYRRAHRSGGQDRPARLFALRLEPPAGRILQAENADGAALRKALRLEPELLAESLGGDRAPRIPIVFDDLPEHVWRPLLAAEDARFFDHVGIDGRGIARALLANARAGGVAQGGSTITQQLIKRRDLTPKRTLGRKASEVMRALALEADYDKEEILEAYLDHVYLGHVDGVSIDGWGTAARVFFSKHVEDLDLAESALLAGMVQGPNRLSPVRNPEAAQKRRDWVLSRMEELGWTAADEVAAARRQAVRLKRSSPPRRMAPQFLRWVAEAAESSAPERLAKGRGLVAETTLDPHLQRLAEDAVGHGLRNLGARGAQAALVALDATTGEVLAHVGGDPRGAGDQFDRVRQAERQPGSAIKPLLLLEAFDRCAGPRDAERSDPPRRPLFPASRVLDAPYRLELPSGPWEPENNDRQFRGVVRLRDALSQSLNVPFARLAGWCGLEATAERAREAGLSLPEEVPPAFVLGAIETTPLRMAEAFTVFATPGKALRPFPVRRLERPGGRLLARSKAMSRRVVRPATGYLVRDMMRTAAEVGTARGGAVQGIDVAGKTGTSSRRRDAWFVGDTGSLVIAVWVGRDDGEPLGLSGAAAAAPIWQRFAAAAAGSRPRRSVERPSRVVERAYDPDTGRRVRETRRGSEMELFRLGALPPHKRVFRKDPALPVVR
ncbi:MAG: transglycosylase domain-containing protein [Acidobacteriota bacterium]